MSAIEVPSARDPVVADELAELCAELQRLRLENQAAKRLIGELRDAVAARDQFIAVAGHELRNPMGAIVLGVSNLLFVARRDESLAPWATVRLEALERQARNFVRRATTLLDVSRLASGELRLDRDLVSLSDVARELVRDMAAEAERARCELRLSIEDGVEGWWDRTAIEQISVNLLSNAVKYGAGHPIEISVSSSDEYATLKVRDHGAGISEMDRARIFERFERAVAPRATQPGFGLGLWITRQLVAAHGGQITVESKPGVGSVFTARLPRAIQDTQR
jgi:signal transduction histidine kinase